MNNLNINLLGFDKNNNSAPGLNTGMDVNTFMAHVGTAVGEVNITSRYGAAGWRLVAAGYDTDGVTPMFIHVNINTAEYACDTWTLAGGMVTKVNRSMLKDASQDLLAGLGNEVTEYRHKPRAWRIYKGRIIVQCSVDDDTSGSYQETYLCVATSDDYGATYSLVERADSATPYVVPPGSFINLTPSNGLATGQHWSLTLQKISDTRVDIMVGDYHANPNSPGATVHYMQMTGGVGSWTNGKLRQIYQVVTSGAHAHIGFNKKIYIGDTAVNRTLGFSFDDGDSSYETSDITTTTIEDVGTAIQGINAMPDKDGFDVISPDNFPSIVQVYDPIKERYLPRVGIMVATRDGGSETFMGNKAEGTGVPNIWGHAYRPTSGISLPTASRRYYVSRDGIAWGVARVDADFNDSSGIMAWALYENGVPYMFDTVSEIFTPQPIQFFSVTPTESGAGGTNVLVGELTDTAITDAVVAECPIVNGAYTWPTGTALAGQVISPQPRDRTSPMYYIEAASSGDELTLDMGSTIGAGDYVARVNVMAAQDTKITGNIRLTDGSNTASTDWSFSGILSAWYEINPFHSPAGTITPRLRCNVDDGLKMFVQWNGIHSGKTPLDHHDYGDTTIPDNTYEEAIPDTGTNGAGSIVSRFRLTGAVDSYFANQNSTGAILLAEYYEDANNHIRLTVTPDATVTNVSTFSLTATVGGTPGTPATATGWLNNRDEITFGISRDDTEANAFFDIGGTGNYLSASVDVQADSIKAGNLPCVHLYSKTSTTLNTGELLRQGYLNDYDLEYDGFTPDDLGSSTLQVWLKSDAGLYQDSSFTTPATSGDDPIGGWQDQSGNAHHLTGSGTSRPLLKLSELDGYSGILFDGSNDTLTSSAFTMPQPTTVYAVMKQVTYTNSDHLFDGKSGNDVMVLYQAGTSPRVVMYAGNNGPVSTAGLVLDTFSIVGCIFNGASSILQINSDAETTGDVGAGNPGGFTLGSQASGGAPGHVEYVEVCVFNRVLNLSERNLMKTYFTNKYASL